MVEHAEEQFLAVQRFEKMLIEGTVEEINQEIRNVINTGIDTNEIHAMLSFKALEKVYQLRADLIFSRHTLEHCIWHLMRQRSLQEDNEVDDAQFQELMHVFQVEKVYAIESLLIELVEKGRLSIEQINTLLHSYDLPYIRKAFLMHEIRTKSQQGEPLSATDVLYLLQEHQYNFLQEALQKKQVSMPGLLMIGKPATQDEKGSRKKRVLHEIAQNLIKGEVL